MTKGIKDVKSGGHHAWEMKNFNSKVMEAFMSIRMKMYQKGRIHQMGLMEAKHSWGKD